MALDTLAKLQEIDLLMISMILTSTAGMANAGEGDHRRGGVCCGPSARLFLSH